MLQRKLADEQLKIPYIDRDFTVHSQLFSSLSKLIASVQVLRAGVHFNPRHTALNISNIQNLCVALWRRVFNALRQLGIQIAIDDFGTGYSSLSYLQDLPLDTLKIDRAFIIRLDTGDFRKSMASNVVMLANSCGLQTVAEGVETIDQLSKVQALGCDLIQGYFYSRPVAASEVPACIDRLDQIAVIDKKAA